MFNRIILIVCVTIVYISNAYAVVDIQKSVNQAQYTSIKKGVLNLFNISSMNKLTAIETMSEGYSGSKVYKLSLDQQSYILKIYQKKYLHKLPQAIHYQKLAAKKEIAPNIIYAGFARERH